MRGVRTRALTCALLKEFFDLDLDIPLDKLIPAVPSRYAAHRLCLPVCDGLPMLWLQLAITDRTHALPVPTRLQYVRWIEELLSLDPDATPVDAQAGTVRGVDMYVADHA